LGNLFPAFCTCVFSSQTMYLALKFRGHSLMADSSYIRPVE
jgi:hypothetical protein